MIAQPSRPRRVIAQPSRPRRVVARGDDPHRDDRTSRTGLR
jgi:hypothetical protein